MISLYVLRSKYYLYNYFDFYMIYRYFDNVLTDWMTTAPYPPLPSLKATMALFEHCNSVLILLEIVFRPCQQELLRHYWHQEVQGMG